MLSTQRYNNVPFGPRLATKEDFAVLDARAEVSEAIIGHAEKYKQLSVQLEKESARPYKNVEWIERTKKILEYLRPYYEKVYGK